MRLNGNPIQEFFAINGRGYTVRVPFHRGPERVIVRIEKGWFVRFSERDAGRRIGIIEQYWLRFMKSWRVIPATQVPRVSLSILPTRPDMLLTHDDVWALTAPSFVDCEAEAANPDSEVDLLYLRVGDGGTGVQKLHVRGLQRCDKQNRPFELAFSGLLDTWPGELRLDYDAETDQLVGITITMATAKPA